VFLIVGPQAPFVSMQADPGDDPLLLVHGYMDSRHAPWWRRLRRRLAEAGYGERVRTLDHGPTPMSSMESPRDHAEGIGRVVERLAAEFDGQVDLLAHSMGGLSARWYVERMDGQRHVDDLVTLGTPHRGTSWAMFGAATPGGRAMIPGSSFLSALNDGSLARQVSYTAVWSRADRVIHPSDSASLDPSWFPTLLGARNVRLEDAGHMELVYDQDLIERYLEFLN